MMFPSGNVGELVQGLHRHKFNPSITETGGQRWGCMLIIPGLKGHRQDDQKFEFIAILNYTEFEASLEYIQIRTQNMSEIICRTL